MSGLGLLGKLKTKRGDKNLEYEWGSSKVLQSLDLDKLPRAALRSHLDARDLDTGGTKRAMIKRLQTDLEGERLQSIAYSEQLESEFHINKDIEERGAVYPATRADVSPRPSRGRRSDRIGSRAPKTQRRVLGPPSGLILAALDCGRRPRYASWDRRRAEFVETRPVWAGFLRRWTAGVALVTRLGTAVERNS